MASTKTPTSFGALLMSYRAHGGWTRREIADAAGISLQFLIYLETSERHPSPDTIERLITAMDPLLAAPRYCVDLALPSAGTGLRDDRLEASAAMRGALMLLRW